LEILEETSRVAARVRDPRTGAEGDLLAEVGVDVTERKVGEEDGGFFETVAVFAGGDDGGDVRVEDDGTLYGGERGKGQ
jgi:hypothetical protein